MGERPIGVTIVGALYLIRGLLLLGVAAIVLGGAGATMVTGLPATTGNQTSSAAATGGIIGLIAGIIGIVLLVAAIINLAIGWFILKGNNIARWAAIIFAILALLGLLMPFNIISIVFAVIVIYFLLIDKEGKAFFEGAKA
ncbi:MAG: hypothetical protein QXK06_02595 [Candidatus Diapherotrites archaeon]